MPVSLTPMRNHSQKKELPADTQETLGGFNLLLVGGFSKARAVSSVFFKELFSIPKDIFKEVDPLADRLSSETGKKLYGRAKRSIFDKYIGKKRPIIAEDSSSEDMEKTLGKFNLTLIDAFSSTRAFGRVFFRRVSSAFKGFSEEVERKSSQFSHETTMKFYKAAQKGKSTAQTRRAPVTPKLSTFEVLDEKTIDTKSKDNEPTKTRSYKRAAIIIAILGVAVFLAYYIFPIFKLEMAKIQDIDFVTKRVFYAKDRVPHCLDVTRAYTSNQEGIREPLYVVIPKWDITVAYTRIKKISISCVDLLICECRDKCLSAKRFWF